MKIFGRKSMRYALAALGLLAVSLTLITPKVMICGCSCAKKKSRFRARWRGVVVDLLRRHQNPLVESGGVPRFISCLLWSPFACFATIAYCPVKSLALSMWLRVSFSYWSRCNR